MDCLFCEDGYSVDDIQELKEFGEEFYHDKKLFICPDCYDSWRRLELEEQIQAFEDGATYEWKIR